MVSQVLVTTLDAQARGDVSALPVPVRFDWLRHLDAAGVTAFFAELLETFRECQETGEWDAVGQVVSAWQETAHLMRDPVLVARMHRFNENPDQPGIPWGAIREELGI
ncbi:MAG: hypothetical protein ACE5GO_05335 [Anaerolineales bacterium]